MIRKKFIGALPRAIFVFTTLTLAKVATVSAQTSNDASTPGEKAVMLDPFTVNNVSTGYSSESTLIGSRTSQNLNDIPMSVTIINAEQLADLHAVNSQMAVAFGAPGVTPNTRVTDDYNVRGFRTEYALIDGITITQSEEKPLYDIDRVEIIRGPVATTLGSNGSDFLGGVINYVTRQPTATTQGYVAATVGNHSTFRVESNASGPAYSDDDLDLQYRVTLGGAKGTPEKAAETLNEQFIGAALKILLGKAKKSEFDFNGSWYQHRNYLYYEDFLDYNSYKPGDRKSVV